MAVRWCTFNENGGYIDTDLTYYSAMVVYALGDKLDHYYWPEAESSLEFNAISYKFPVGGTSHSDSTWAKMGEITIELTKDPSINANMHYVKIAGLYGHSVLNVGSPALSITSGGDIGICFTGGTRIDNIAGAKKKIFCNGDETVLP